MYLLAYVFVSYCVVTIYKIHFDEQYEGKGVDFWTTGNNKVIFIFAPVSLIIYCFYLFNLTLYSIGLAILDTLRKK